MVAMSTCRQLLLLALMLATIRNAESLVAHTQSITAKRSSRPLIHLTQVGGNIPKVPAEQLPKAASEAEPPPRFAELLKFTLLAMPIYVAPTLLSLIDTATVGQVSSVQLAALGPACAICDAISTMMVFISVGTTNSVSTAINDGNPGDARRAATVSVVTSFGIGCAVALLLWTAIGPIIANIAAPAAVASTLARTGGDAAAAAVTTELWAACEIYVRIRALSFPFSLTLMSAQASCLGAKDSLSPTFATLIASAVNIIGDALFVLGPLAMGIAGAAWATVGCQVAAALMLMRTLHAKGLLDRQTLAQLPTPPELRRFFAFGAFIIVLFVKQLVYNQAVLLASILGTAAGAAHQCLFSVFRLCCTLGDVTGATAQSFLPRFYVTDAKSKQVRFDERAARPTIQRIVAMTALVAACNTAITLSVPLLHPGLFTADHTVVRLMRRAAPIAAVGLLLHPPVVGMEGCLLAMKDVRWLVRNYAVTGTVAAIATQVLLKVTLFRPWLSLDAIWVYLATFQAARFVTFAWRLARPGMPQAEAAAD